MSVLSLVWLNNTLAWGHVGVGLVTILFTGISALLWLAVYRLYFHPLASVPGPRWAAVTDFWRFSWEIRGVLPFRLKELHAQNKWPPIIRTGPNQVVIHDPAQFDVIFRVNSPFMKDRKFYEIMTSGRTGNTTVTTCDKNVHASRRKDTMAQLSKQKVALLQPLVSEKLSVLIGHIEKLCETGRPVNVFNVWKSLTLDVISEYAFGQCLDTLKDPSFESDVVRMMDVYSRSFLWLVIFPRSMLKFLAALFQGPKAECDFFRWSNHCVINFRPDEDRNYLFNGLMDPKRPEQLSTGQLESEAEDILIAGSDTTAVTLTYACVHLARQPHLWEELYREISPVYGPSDRFPALRPLENVPLLVACIKESLRLASPVPSYLWRTVPAEGYAYSHGGATYHVPAGTSIGMSPWNQHHNEEIFPEPHEFRPSRWLGKDSAELDGYLVAFSKGTRGCGGLNLAYLEMYLALAAMVMRFRVMGEAEPGKELVLQDQFIGLFKDTVWNLYLEPRTAAVGS